MASCCPEPVMSLRWQFYSKTLTKLIKCLLRSKNTPLHPLTQLLNHHLLQIIEGSKAWRDSWRDILGTQERLVHGFQTIYSPVIGSDENYSGHEPVETPRSTMERTVKLQEAYVGLRTDLLEEVETIEARIIKPASDAKDSIQPLKKIIKKRGDRKVRRDLN